MTKFLINKKKFAPYKNVLLIGEIGCNHDNSLKKCEKLIEIAKYAGFDAVKFQLFKADQLVPKKSAAYNILKKYELSERWINKISKLCKKNKILFACSPFYLKAIDILVKNKCDILKIASPEIKNIPLIKKASNSNLPLIISTGDSSLKEINNARKILKKQNIKKTAFLHCVSEYPTKIKNLNLDNINYLKKNLRNHNIGFSDHSLGIDASINAVALGASIIEKHITLSRKSNGPDHFFAIEPVEAKIMINKIKNFLISFGINKKKRLKDENTIFIKIFSKDQIEKGDKVTEKNVKCLRSVINRGIDGKDYYKIIGKRTKKMIKKESMINLDFLE